MPKRVARRPLSDIKKVACTVLKRPKAVASTEAAHAALLLAHVAWNQTVTPAAARVSYRPMLVRGGNPLVEGAAPGSDSGSSVNGVL